MHDSRSTDQDTRFTKLCVLPTENQADQPEERQHKDCCHKQPREHKLQGSKLREIGLMSLAPSDSKEGRSYSGNGTHNTATGRQRPGRRGGGLWGVGG